MKAAAGLALALVLLAIPLAQAAEQPREAPSDFRNGQDSAFGSIAMEPYVPAGDGDGPVPIEARVVIRDMGALLRAETLMLALNLHTSVAAITVDGAFDSEGQPIPTLRKAKADDGRQAQLFVSAGEVASRAVDGEAALTFRGHATPRATGQLHVGVLVAAYSGDWVMERSADGPAQLYGYSLVQSWQGGGLMPFRGQGNTMMVLPIVFLAFVVLAAGGMAVQVLRAGAVHPVPAPTPAGAPAPATFVPFPASPGAPPVAAAAPVPPQPKPRLVVGNSEIEVAGPIPVFGSPVSPVLGKPLPAPAPTAPVPAPAAAAPAPEPPISSGPVQGPLLPPHLKQKLFGVPPADAAASETPAAPAPSSTSPAPTVAPPPAPSSPKPTAAAPPPPPPAKPQPPPKATRPRATTAARRPKRPAAARHGRAAPAAKRGQASR